MVVRIILSIFLSAVALFCVFGLLSTFEPLPTDVQWTWRAIYSLILIGNLAGIVHLVRGIR